MALPEEVAAAPKGMSFGENSFQAGGDITGFVTGFGASRDQSETDLERGYSADRQGMIAGMRVERPGYALFFGLDVSREDQDYAPDSLGAVVPGGRPILVPPASIDREDIGISLGASVDLRPGLVWHGAARVGFIDIGTRRTTYDLCSKDGIAEGCPPDNIENTFIGRGSSDGTSIAIQTGLSSGRSLGSGFHGGLSGSVLYVREKFDGFTEYVDDTLPDGTDEGFSFGSDTRKSLVSRIGVEVARPVRMGGAMVVPSLRAAWLHEFADDSRTIAVHATVPAAPNSLQALCWQERARALRDAGRYGDAMEALDRAQPLMQAAGTTLALIEARQSCWLTCAGWTRPLAHWPGSCRGPANPATSAVRRAGRWPARSTCWGGCALRKAGGLGPIGCWHRPR